MPNLNRAQTRNPYARLLDVAAHRAGAPRMNDLVNAGASLETTPAAIPGAATETTPALDENGEVISQWPFQLDLDALDDPHTFLE